MSSSLKRTSLSFEDYKERREKNFALLNNSNNQNINQGEKELILKMLKKDLQRIIQPNEDEYGNPISGINQNAINLGRNVSTPVSPKEFQNFIKIIDDKDINFDVKKEMVYKIYEINENFRLNQKLYSNLNSFSNSLSSNSNINKDQLDESFEANKNYLHKMSYEIIKNKPKNIENLQKIFQFLEEFASNKSRIKDFSNQRMNEEINSAFEKQNAAFRTKKDISKELDENSKENLNIIGKYSREIGELESKNQKLEKIPERITQIIARLDEITSEKKILKDQKNHLGKEDETLKTVRKDLKNNIEDQIESAEKEIKSLKKESKKIYKLITGKDPIRDKENVKDKIALSQNAKNANQNKDILYIKNLLGEGNKNQLKQKIEENNNSIKQNSEIKQKIKNYLIPINAKLEENAKLIKQKDELKLSLAKLNSKIFKNKSDKGEIENLKKGISKKNELIKVNNKEIAKQIKKINSQEDGLELDLLKEQTSEIKQENKKISKDLKFQERNPLNKGKNIITKTADKIDKKFSIKENNKLINSVNKDVSDLERKSIPKKVIAKIGDKSIPGLSSAKNAIGKRLESAVSKIGEGLGNAKDKIGEGFDNTKDKIGRKIENFGSRIQSQNTKLPNIVKNENQQISQKDLEFMKIYIALNGIKGDTHDKKKKLEVMNLQNKLIKEYNKDSGQEKNYDAIINNYFIKESLEINIKNQNHQNSENLLKEYNKIKNNTSYQSAEVERRNSAENETQITTL